MCRESHGYLNSSSFNMWTCMLCYNYLFQHRKSVMLEPNWNKIYPRLIGKNMTTVQSMQFITDLENSAHTEKICKTLTPTDCVLWKSCCQSASKCCSSQIHKRSDTIRNGSCPMTWDGFGCFLDTPMGTIATITCPQYIEYGFSSGLNQIHI